MKCTEIMTLDPKVCVPEDNVAVAANFMWDYDCGDVLVVKDIESKQLVGLVTDRDIAMCVAKHVNAHPSEVKVSMCMSSPAIACNEDDLIETAIQMMSEHKIRRIPVVDGNGSCTGIISQADLLTHVSDIEPVIAMLKQISVPWSKGESATNEETSSDSTPKEETSAESVVKEEPSAKSDVKKSKTVKNEAL